MIYLKGIILFFLYFGAAKLGVILFPMEGFATVFWPASGVALAFLYLWGTRLWPAVFFSSFLFELISHNHHWYGNLGIAIGQTLAPLAGIAILQRFDFHKSFNHLKDALIFGLLVATLTPLISVTIGILSLTAFKIVPFSEFFPLFETWYIGNTLGILKFGALILIYSQKPPLPTRQSKIEFSFLILFSLLTIYIIVFYPFNLFLKPLFFNCVLFWGTVRFGSWGAITSNVLMLTAVALVAAFGNSVTVLGIPLDFQSFEMFQIFMAFLTFSMLVVGASITEKDLAIQSIAAANAVALESVQIKSRFLANMSHEIRTPMYGILGTTELLGKTSLTPDQKEQVGIIESSGKNLLKILDDILNFSLIEEGKLVLKDDDFSVRGEITQVIELLQPQAKTKKLELTFYVADDVPSTIRSDVTRVTQILLNLLSNAIKFTEQGKVELRISKKENNILFFEVQDTGIGISEEDQKKLFTPFTQIETGKVPLKHRESETGLGLAISKALVEMMDGQIGIHSTLGAGSTFWFAVPFKSSEQQESQKTEEPQAQSQTTQSVKKNRILIAEDDPVNQRVLALQLASLGYHPDLASNGLEVLEKTKKMSYDLIFMDCLMPQVDGFAATTEIRKREGSQQHTIIIALTAFAMQEDKDKAIRCGMDDFLSKPVKIQNLEAKLQKYLKATFIPKKIPEKVVPSAPIALENLKELLKGNKEAIHQLLEQFTSDLLKNLAQLRSLKDPTQIYQVAHKCLGSSGTLGCEAIAALFRQIQIKAQENCLQEIPPLLDEIEQELKKARAYWKENL